MFPLHLLEYTSKVIVVFFSSAKCIMTFYARVIPIDSSVSQKITSFITVELCSFICVDLLGVSNVNLNSMSNVRHPNVLGPFIATEASST